ncbi:MAG: hypothetical protein JAY90_20215 [Candidatus Thiodiazotropha lotti]|nr:hypothetical protein [Candidatus Thiodiazotropha lotti]
MAYSTDNPPALESQAVGGKHRSWVYRSDDALSLVRVNGYFSNGYELGMRAGDTIKIIDENASPIDYAVSVVASADATAGVNLTDGTEVAGADTD